MASLAPRIEILKTSGMLCEDNHRCVQNVIEYFAQKQGIELTEENAASFITHLCQSLERIKNGEEIHALDEEVYRAATEEPTFERAWAISQELKSLLPPIPEVELQFIVMHVGVLLSMSE